MIVKSINKYKSYTTNTGIKKSHLIISSTYGCFKGNFQDKLTNSGAPLGLPAH